MLQDTATLMLALLWITLLRKSPIRKHHSPGQMSPASLESQDIIDSPTSFDEEGSRVARVTL